MVDDLLKGRLHPSINTHANVAAHKAPKAYLVDLSARREVAFGVVVCSILGLIRVPFAESKLILVPHNLLGNDRGLRASIVLERDPHLADMCHIAGILHDGIRVQKLAPGLKGPIVIALHPL